MELIITEILIKIEELYCKKDRDLVYSVLTFRL